VRARNAREGSSEETEGTSWQEERRGFNGLGGAGCCDARGEG
jgi:hypothetical protein